MPRGESSHVALCRMAFGAVGNKIRHPNYCHPALAMIFRNPATFFLY